MSIRTSLVFVVTSFAALCVQPAWAAVRAPGGEVRLWESGNTLVYNVESATLLNEAARKDQEVGWQIHAKLAVSAVACSEHEALLRFEVRSAELRSRRAARLAQWARVASVWDAPPAAALAHWHRGRIARVFLPTAHAPPVADFHRALISLFQFQIVDGERNETDVSGECSVSYESLGERDFRKIKKHCRWRDTDDATSGVTSRRLTRYTLRASLDALQSVYSEELHTLTALAAGEDDAGVKVRSWLRLTLAGEEEGGACAAGAPGLAGARGALPHTLQETTLPLAVAEDTTSNEIPQAEGEEPPLTVEQALKLSESLSGGEEGGGGDIDTAHALLRVVEVLRRARCSELLAYLHRLDDARRLEGVCMGVGALGGAGDAGAGCGVEAARGAPPAAAAALLAALSLAPAPHPALAHKVLSLGAESRSPRVRQAALLAAAAIASKGDESVAASVKDELTKQLARCKDDECRSIRLLALGNLRRIDTAELLLEHLERSTSTVALSAVRALESAPVQALPWPRCNRLISVSLNASRPLEVRAGALQLAVRGAARTPLQLADCARRLHAAPEDFELRRVFWQRLRALAEEEEGEGEVGRFLRAAGGDPQLGSWHARAHAGTSSVLRREAGWGAGWGRAALDSAQLAAAGVLRRGLVSLQLHNVDRPVLGVEIWTRGLAAIAGGSEGGAGGAGQGQGEGEEEASAGLVLEVGGARMPPVTLFSSQAELLGHVWAGTGSAPTRVLRAAAWREAGRGVALVPLGCGSVARMRAAAAAAVALDAHATVSLWSRTASAGLELRAAVVGTASAFIDSPYGTVSVTANATAPARLNIATDLDFYDKVSVCVRASTSEHVFSRHASLRSGVGPRGGGGRVRGAARRREGRTLSLGAVNDRACRGAAPLH